MDIQTVEKVARLACIELKDEEKQPIADKLTQIIDWVEMLGEVDTDNVEPLANVVNIDLKLREDAVTDGGVQDKVLANAPEETQGFFVVPKIVE